MHIIYFFRKNKIYNKIHISYNNIIFYKLISFIFIDNMSSLCMKNCIDNIQQIIVLDILIGVLCRDAATGGTGGIYPPHFKI